MMNNYGFCILPLKKLELKKFLIPKFAKTVEWKNYLEKDLQTIATLQYLLELINQYKKLKLI